jgi:uncharacterized protein (DUF2267 family)
VVVGTLHPR